MTCPLCSRDRKELAECSACAFYVLEALGIDGSFDAQIRHGTTRISPIVRHLAPVCYLCGKAPTEHADHVVSRARGGQDTWSNLGGACAECNERKGDRLLDLSADQAARLAEQQRAIRGAFDAIGGQPDRFWLAFYDDQIEIAVEDIAPLYIEDPTSITREDIRMLGFSFDTDRSTHPFLPQSAIDAICDEVLSRLSAL